MASDPVPCCIKSLALLKTLSAYELAIPVLA